MFEPELWEYDTNMAPIFASADIASLVANFEPLAIQQDRPLLVKSRSGEHLVNLAKITKKFDFLLRTWESRIQKSSLSTFLGIEPDAERLVLENLRGPIYESRDGTQVLPEKYIRKVLDTLEDESRKSCVDLSAFASENDIAAESLDRLVDQNAERGWERLNGNGQEYVCGEEMLEEVKGKLQDAIGSAGSEICDLPATLSQSVPLPVLSAVGKDIVATMGGDIRMEADHVVYVPANYSEAVEERLEQIREERIRELVHRLGEDEYCVITTDDVASLGSGDTAAEVTPLDQAVLDEYEKSHQEDTVHSLQLLPAGDRTSRNGVPHITSTILIKSTLLENELSDMKSSAVARAEQIWRSGDRVSTLKSFVQFLQRNELDLPNQSELWQLLAQTDRANELLPAVREKLEQLENETQEKFNQLVEARLLVPLQLYTSGIETIKDATLKEHLEDFVFDHFKREVIPQMIKAVHEQSLLREKDRERQVEKFRQATSESKNFEQLQSAVSKFSKKLKIDQPDEDMLKRVKEKTLQAAVKSLVQMKRGSDVLQNLIWIALARERDGLFMSSGKDTSRMIKQVEEKAIAEQLVKWRDLLKSGGEGREDVQKMRELAMRAFEETRPKLERRKSSMSSRSEGRRKSAVSFTATGEEKEAEA